MAACASCVGAIILARSVSTNADPRPGLAFLLFACLAFLIWALWSSLSWFLAAAPIFVVREGRDTFGALLETATLFRNRPGPVIAVGSWFGLAHLILLIGASTVVGFPLAFARLRSAGHHIRRSPSADAGLFRARRRALHRTPGRIRRDSRSTSATTSACPIATESPRESTGLSPVHASRVGDGRSKRKHSERHLNAAQHSRRNSGASSRSPRRICNLESGSRA